MNNDEFASYVAWLDRLVKADAGARGAIRYGDNSSREFLADQYLLGRLANEPNLAPFRRHAALVAQNPRILNKPGAQYRLGTVLAKEVRSGKTSGASVEQQIVLLQSQSMPTAHKTIRSLLTRADTTSLDWTDLLTMYVFWDKGGPRFPARRRLLEQYYRTPARTTDGESILTPPDEATLDTEPAVSDTDPSISITV